MQSLAQDYVSRERECWDHRQDPRNSTTCTGRPRPLSPQPPRVIAGSVPSSSPLLTHERLCAWTPLSPWPDNGFCHLSTAGSEDNRAALGRWAQEPGRSFHPDSVLFICGRGLSTQYPQYLPELHTRAPGGQTFPSLPCSSCGHVTEFWLMRGKWKHCGSICLSREGPQLLLCFPLFLPDGVWVS